MQAALCIDGLADAALEAARAFYDLWLARAEEMLGGADALAIVLPPAPYDHDGWRRAVARDLARAHAPKRVNVVSGSDQTDIGATLAYLATAPGITGQYLQTR